MDPGQLIFLFCLVAFIVIGINAFLYVTLKQRSTITQVDLLRKAADRARDPWGEENANLAELSARIADLREQGLLDESTTQKLVTLAESLASEDIEETEQVLEELRKELPSEDQGSSKNSMGSSEQAG